MRTSNGCWTCRIRRKKCDEVHPVCMMCATLHITCHFDPVRPPWLDGGVRQDEMAHKIKLEIKTSARRNRGVREINRAGKKIDSTKNASASKSCYNHFPSPASSTWCQPLVVDSDSAADDSITVLIDTENICPATGVQPLSPDPPVESRSFTPVDSQISPLLPVNAIYSAFYLDHLSHFLYPFYQPSNRRGGRAWILELLTTSAAFRQTVLCYSKYFHTLIFPLGSDLAVGVHVNQLSRTEEPFTTLSQSLQTLLNVTNLRQHTHCASRVLTSIIQIHRYEVSISNYSNWRAHLDAASTLFIQLVDDCSAAADGQAESDQGSLANGFQAILTCMNMIATGSQVSFTTQEAFVFSSGIMVFDDIVAAASSRQEPRLYHYHQYLLGGDDPELELETVIGVKNWVLRHLGEVASLDARKQKGQSAGNLDGLALAQRASEILQSLATKLRDLSSSSSSSPSKSQSGEGDCLEGFHVLGYSHHTRQDVSMVSQVWAHATIVYLITVISGWQPANIEVRHHVDQIVELLRSQVSAPLIRTMAWPLCVAGCLADPSQRHLLRGIVSRLQPAAFFANVHKAIDIMEWTWQQKSDDCKHGTTHLDLSACFRSQGESPLLV